MPLTKPQKKEILDSLMLQMKEAKSVIFADYQGMTVKEVKGLRTKLREKGVKYTIAKRTLFKLAAKELGYGDIPNSALQGPVGAAFSIEDEIVPAKIIFEVAKKNKNLKLRGAILNGKILSVAETMQLATLPGKEELLAKLVYILKSPIQGFHGVLQGTLSGFVRVLDAIAKQKA